jgi:hypothetical protein
LIQSSQSAGRKILKLREKVQIAVFFFIQKITAIIDGYVAMVNCLLASTNLGRFGKLLWVKMTGV